MCIIKDTIVFFRNGARILRQASRGEYIQTNDTIQVLKRDFTEIKIDRAADKKNLMNDRRNVEKDVRTSFEKLILRNV